MVKGKVSKRRIAAILTASMLMSASSVPTMAADVSFPESVPVVAAEADSAVESIGSAAESVSSVAEKSESLAESTDSAAESEAASVAEPAESVAESTQSLVESVSSKAEEAESVVTVEEEPTVSANNVEDEYHEVGSVTMYRLYNPNSGEHFYTADVNEVKQLRFVGWKYENVGWIAPEKSDQPVYRLYNPNAGDHHYTTSAGERDHLVSVGWKYEQIGWYSASPNKIKLLRQYNKNAKAGAHNFTTNPDENDMLVSVGWKAEGVAWYALKASQPKFSAEIQPVTTFRGIDYADIYDFKYFRAANPSLKFGEDDDAEAIEYFVTKGLLNNMQGKEGVTSGNETYQKLRQQFVVSISPEQKYASNTNYLITVDSKTHTVKVFQGKQYNWKEIFSTKCTLGAAATPTYKGVFMTRYGGYYFDSGSVRCFYYTPFNGSIYFHSVLYAQTSTPQVCVDPRLGVNISHGCVRLPLSSAKYIYDKFGNSSMAEAKQNHHTTVVVY